MSRAFLCLELDDSTRLAVDAFVDTLREIPIRVAWTNAANLHVTLKFLGETDPARFATIARSVKAVAQQFPTFDLNVSGTGAFPNWIAPRILWVGAEDPTPTLHTLAEALEPTLAASGFPEELRPYKPHITIGRVHEAYSLQFLQRKLKLAPDFGLMTVRWLTLMRSDPYPSGSRYSVIARLALASTSSPKLPTNGNFSAP